MVTHTIDLEPTWMALCRGVEIGSLPADTLRKPCQIADLVRQAQKSGAKHATFTFTENGECTFDHDGTKTEKVPDEV